MTTNPYISMIPGTNTLIYKNPAEGQALFKRHGVDIQHPRHRDYYNMLRNRRRNQAFFSDLFTTIANITGKLSEAGVFNSRSKQITTPARSASLSAISNTTPSSQPVGGFASQIGESYMGDNDRIQRVNPHQKRQYDELMRHLHQMTHYGRDPHYLPVAYALPIGGYTVGGPVTGPQWIDDGTDEPPQLQLPGFTTPAEHHELPVIGDTIFGINKKLV
ncbi:MAG: hypothetical protein ACXVJE_19330, partial [Mucilaginibacter sp.]